MMGLTYCEMIALIDFINIHYLRELHEKKRKKFLLLWWDSQIYSNDFPVQFAAESSHMQWSCCTSLGLIYLMLEMCLLTSLVPISSSLFLVPGNLTSLLWVWFFRFHMWDHTVFLFSVKFVWLQLGLSLPAASLTPPLLWTGFLSLHAWNFCDISMVFCYFFKSSSSSFRISPSYSFLLHLCCYKTVQTNFLALHSSIKSFPLVSGFCNNKWCCSTLCLDF